MNKPHPGPPPLPPDLKALSIEQLIDLIEMQQRTIRFLISEYDALLEMVNDCQKPQPSPVFGPPVTIAAGQTIPVGWWLVVDQPISMIGDVTIGSYTVTVEGGYFWSDGTLVSQNGNVIAAVAVKPPPTPPTP